MLLDPQLVVSALDFRLGWSSMPEAISVTGDALVAIGLLIAMITTIQNGYAAANVKVEAVYAVVSTGVYSVVRHPLYFGNVMLTIGTPPALGSYRGLLFVIPRLGLLVTRILDEETMLTRQVRGHGDFAQRVHTPLMSYVW